MIEQTYSITRTRATWKPRIAEVDLPFFVCAYCGRVHLGVTGHEPAVYSGTGRTLIAAPPYARDLQQAPPCCGATMQRMPYVELEKLPESIKLDYRILGGFNNNAVECSWSIADDRFAPIWVALKTFTGSQMKYVLPKKRSPILFALADEDAYVYCDEQQCLECTFMCKRGFVAYVGIQDRSTAESENHIPLTTFIARLPLTRMSPYWESRPEEERNQTRAQ